MRVTPRPFPGTQAVEIDRALAGPQGTRTQ